MSWNVRDINDCKKRTIIRGCLNKWKPEVVYIQESKLESCDDAVMKSLWRVRDLGDTIS